MHRRHQIAILFCLEVLAFGISPVGAQQPPRFAAQFASGKRLTGAEIRNWHDSQVEPHLDSTRLLVPEDRVLWIDDTTLPVPVDPPACLEFFGGDRLPGRVVDARPANESLFRKTPAVVIVQPSVMVDWPEARRPLGIPVVARWLRRVIWQRRDDSRYRPGTLFFRDGRQVEYRSVRWQSSSVKVLIDQETRDVPFAEIAELHLPRLDPWDAWFHQLAALAPDLTGWLTQWETGEGLRITASWKRILPTFRGDGGNPDHWVQGIQPAWSVEPLWLRHRSVRSRRFFLPHEVPLTSIEPQRSVTRTSLAGGWNWQVDRNVYAAPLRCAELAWGWGLGVHAYSELTFDLPACVRSFRTQYGLDASAGSGGCVRAVINAGPATGPVVHRSGHVIGSDKSYDSGVLALPGAKQLTLVADAAHDDRPAGADPLEIRDSFVWLLPVIELDPTLLAAEIEKRLESPVWGWSGWSLGNVAAKPCVVSQTWIPRPAPGTRCRIEVAPRDGFLAIARTKVEIRPSDRFLALAVNRLEKDTTPSRVQVRIAGRTLAEFEVPVHPTTTDPDPILVPIDRRHRGETVNLELLQIAAGPNSRVEWRGIAVVPGDPAIREIFDEDWSYPQGLSAGNGLAFFDVRERYLGGGSLRIVGEDRGQALVPGWNLPVRGEPLPGEYRYLRWVWKKRGGKQLGLHLARAGEFASAAEDNPRDALRYHIGRGMDPDYGRSVSLRDTPPDQWEMVTRDLWSDFGAFDLTGIRFVSADGDSAWFDHVVLGRTPQDLDRATARATTPAVVPLNQLAADVRANVEMLAVEPLQFGAVLSQVAPLFSTTASEQGVWLLKSFQGKSKVVRTHPPGQGQPCILRAALAWPAGKRAELKLTAGHHPQSDWQLIVLANGERIHDSLISADTAKDGWLDLTVDLSRFAGKNVNLEIHNFPNNWANEFAYWGNVDVVFP